MIQRSLRFLPGLFLLPALSAAFAQAQPKASPSPVAGAANSAFGALLDRAKKGDRTLDFKELRFAYTETSDYSPYGSDRDLRSKMFAALNSKDFATALEFAEKILKKNFLDLNAQFGAAVAHRQLEHAEQAGLHKFLFEGLINSIEKSGDGKSADTAFVVISTDEEYALLNWKGLRATGQALVHQDGHSYDRMTAVNSQTNETVTYFFNIDKPFNWLGKSLKQ